MKSLHHHTFSFPTFLSQILWHGYDVLYIVFEVLSYIDMTNCCSDLKHYSVTTFASLSPFVRSRHRFESVASLLSLLSSICCVVIGV